LGDAATDQVLERISVVVSEKTAPLLKILFFGFIFSRHFAGFQKIKVSTIFRVSTHLTDKSLHHHCRAPIHRV
jgi:hypothetical protein